MAGAPETPVVAAVSALQADELLEFLRRQRWFGAKGASPAAARIAELVVLPWGDGCYGLARVSVTVGEVTRDYQLPIGARVDAPSLPDEAIIARTENDHRTTVVYDAVHDAGFRTGLADALANGAAVDAGRTRWIAETVRTGWNVGGDASTTVGSAEQSNTSIVIGGRAIYKLFRSLSPGVHPDVEVTRFLTTRAAFAHTPALLAETRFETDGERITTGVLQEFLSGSSDAWSFALERGRAYFAASPEREPANEFADDARRLGRVTREMHDALGSGAEPAFAPEPLNAEDLERWADGIQQSVRASLSLLASQTEAGRVPAQRAAEARALVRRGDHYASLIDEVVDTVGDDLGVRIRTHGDYHLGQVLHTVSDDFTIIDFEGEPARPLEERRQKTSPLRDVAGMLRSFAYAAATLATSVEHQIDAATRELRAARWERDVRAAFLDGYLEKKAGATPALLPRDESNVRRLLSLFETEKAFYELTYELNNRPAWVWIPMRGISKLLVGR